ncbi:MAG: PEGA domain-containing protein [Kofleriaceae bacterium]
MRATLLVLLLVLVSSTARAEDENNVGVVVTGQATLQPALVNQIEHWLRKNGHTVVASPLQPDAINTVIDCLLMGDENCARGVIEKRSKSRQVVFTKVDREAGQPNAYAVTAYWFDKGKNAVLLRRVCESCTEAVLRTTADELMAALTRATRKDVGQLRCTSMPSGASVTVDGKAIGLTPLEADVTAGKHEVVINHPTHEREVREITVRPGEPVVLDVPLKARPEDQIRGPNRDKPLAFGLIGGGGALVVTGVLLYMTSEDDEGSGFQYRETRLLGASVGLVGAAAVAVGFYFFTRKPRAESAPTVSVVRGGTVVGWTRTF